MSKPLLFIAEAWEEYLYWQAQDKRTLKKINQLLRDIQRNAFEGIGKPEPLKSDKLGLWSRRIDESNRVLYRVTDAQLKYCNAAVTTEIGKSTNPDPLRRGFFFISQPSYH